MKSQTISRYAFLIFFLLIAVLSFFVIKPFLMSILAGMLVAYLFFPMYKKINEKTGRENLSAFISTVLILLVVSLPFLVLMGAVTKDVKGFYTNTKSKLSKINLNQISEECDNFACDIKNEALELMANPSVSKHLQNILATISNLFVNYTSSMLISLPKLLLDFFVMIFIIFYGFKDGEKIVRKLYDLLPFKQSFKQDLQKQTSDVVFATIYGIVLVGLIQGFVATIGYFIFGLKNPVFWGFVTTLTAILPFVGPPMVWLPAAAVMIIKGVSASNNFIAWKGVGLLVYGILIISTIDNLVKPGIISSKSKIHPAVIIVGLFGGIFFMGPMGIILGPLLLAILISFIKVYEKDRKQILM